MDLESRSAPPYISAGNVVNSVVVVCRQVANLRQDLSQHRQFHFSLMSPQDSIHVSDQNSVGRLAVRRDAKQELSLFHVSSTSTKESRGHSTHCNLLCCVSVVVSRRHDMLPLKLTLQSLTCLQPLRPRPLSKDPSGQ